jgi:hypothetical protein
MMDDYGDADVLPDEELTDIDWNQELAMQPAENDTTFGWSRQYANGYSFIDWKNQKKAEKARMDDQVLCRGVNNLA